ncbi:MAG: hypothetical protein EZS28_037330, partial [Streblomastix strix]
MLVSVANIAADMSGMHWDKSISRYRNLLFYLRANIPVIITEVGKMISIEYCQSADKKAIISVILAVVLGFLALIIPLIVNVLQFLLTIRRLKSERHKVFFILAKAPKSEFLNLKKRLEDVEKEEEEIETHSFVSEIEKSQQEDNDHDTSPRTQQNPQKIEKKGSNHSNENNITLEENEIDIDQKIDSNESKSQRIDDEIENDDQMQIDINNIRSPFGSFIPTVFYARAAAGFVLIMAMPFVFSVIAIYSSLAAMFNDFSSMSPNYTLIQELLGKSLNFLQQINVRLLFGTSSNEASDITGDSRIDSITSARTLKKDSETQTVQYNVRECFENREG